jgi:hypothetical protein
MEIGWTDVGSGGYILVSSAHSNASFKSVHVSNLFWSREYNSVISTKKCYSKEHAQEFYIGEF